MDDDRINTVDALWLGLGLGSDPNPNPSPSPDPSPGPNRNPNQVDAIWSKSKNEVTAEQHSEFYQYIAQVLTRVSLSGSVRFTGASRRPGSWCARLSTSPTG